MVMVVLVVVVVVPLNVFIKTYQVTGQSQSRLLYECCTLLVQYPVSIISCWPISALIIFTKTPDINISLVTIIHSNNRGQPLGWAARIMAKKTAAVVFISCLLFIIFCWWLPGSLPPCSLAPQILQIKGIIIQLRG